MIDPIVLIPGFMGSRLVRARDGKLIWLDTLWALTHLPEFLRELRLSSPTDEGLSADGILESVDVGSIVKAGIYAPLRAYALSPSGLGLEPSEYHEFPYDWRKSVREAARDLDSYLEGFPVGRKITLIAHSQGGLVAAELFRMAGPGASRVARLVAAGCPFAGLLMSIQVIENGAGILIPDPLQRDPIRDLLLTMPGAYELMPSRTGYRMFFDAVGNETTPFDAAGQMPSRYDQGLLADAGSVAKNLPLTFPVPLLRVVGLGLPTSVSGRIQGQEIELTTSTEGDLQCPAVSLRAAQGTAARGEPAVRELVIQPGEHVTLLRRDEFFQFLSSELPR